jgi:DNA-binding CsgD family transcriptional regulator
MRDRAGVLLTRRERIILRRLAGRGTKADIARDMFVSVNTIKTHVANIYAKLGVGNRSDAVLRARELGILASVPDNQALQTDDDSGFVLTAGDAVQYLLDLNHIYSSRDDKLFEQIHRDDVRWVSPVSVCSGRAAMWDRALELATAVPDLRGELLGLTVESHRNTAIYEYRVSGTHLGPVYVRDRWYPATGMRFEYASMAVVAFDRSGLVVEVRSYFDFTDVVHQIGLAPV